MLVRSSSLIEKNCVVVSPYSTPGVVEQPHSTGLRKHGRQRRVQLTFPFHINVSWQLLRGLSSNLTPMSHSLKHLYESEIAYLIHISYSSAQQPIVGWLTWEQDEYSSILSPYQIGLLLSNQFKLVETSMNKSTG